jgi:glycosyltransferase involved in cell wall biosynthesis
MQDIFHVKKILEEKKDDVDYIFGLQAIDAVRASYYGKLYRIPSANFVFECPDWLERRVKNEGGLIHLPAKLLKTHFKWDSFKEALLKTDRIFVISDTTKSETEKWINRKIDAVIHPGVDTDYVDSIPDQKEENQIIHVGRLAPNKRVELILKALAKMRYPPNLVLVGDGPLRDKLVSLASDLKVPVKFKGRLSDYDKWVEIKKSMFLVTATSFEGSADVPAEALYCGKPCLASDLPIIKDEYGSYVDYFTGENTDDMAKRIRYLCSNPNYRKKKGAEGREFVKKTYTLNNAAKKIEEVLSK